MKRRFAALVGIVPLAVALAWAPLAAQARAQQGGGSPIDDLLKRAQDAFNDLNYPRADSLARQVLQIGTRISGAQRSSALMVIAAAAYPEEASAQRRSVALATLKQLVRTNLNLKMPQDLSWAGLDSLVGEAKRTTFAMEVTGEAVQTVVGPEGAGKLTVRGSRPGTYHLTIMPAAGGAAVIADVASNVMVGEFRIPTMRGERPVFSTGEYAVIVTAIDSVSKDTVTARYVANVEAPPLDFLTLPTKMDSTKLLPARTRKFGAKSILPALMVGGAVFALSSVLHPPGAVEAEAGADPKGAAVGGALALTTILAGFADRGRSIPANIAANKAFGEAFQKSIADAQSENRRRIAQHTITIRLDLEVR